MAKRLHLIYANGKWRGWREVQNKDKDKGKARKGWEYFACSTGIGK